MAGSTCRLCGARLLDGKLLEGVGFSADMLFGGSSCDKLSGGRLYFAGYAALVFSMASFSRARGSSLTCAIAAGLGAGSPMAGPSLQVMGARPIIGKLRGDAWFFADMLYGGWHCGWPSGGKLYSDSALQRAAASRSSVASFSAAGSILLRTVAVGSTTSGMVAGAGPSTS